MADNIFDLSKLAKQSNDIEIKSEQIEINDNYELVDKENWSKIPYKTFIRYLRKDGSLRKGGFIKTIWKTKDTSGQDTLKIDLISGFGFNGTEWSIYSSSIEKIWKRKENMTEIEQPTIKNTEIDDMKEELQYLKRSIDHIKKELQNISNEQMRIVQLIKKLHNIK